MEEHEKKALTRREQALETRRKLFSTALEAFAHMDMDSVRIRDLCADAGVSVGTFYNYFNTKEELLLEAYRFFDEEIVAKARSKTYNSHLEALYCIVSYQCGNSEGLFDSEKEPQAFEIMRLYKEGELILWKQVLRILLKNGGTGVIESERPMNKYVLELVEKALDAGELIADEPADKIARTVLRISRGTIFDWAVRNEPYCLHKRAVSDVKHYLKAFRGHRQQRPTPSG